MPYADEGSSALRLLTLLTPGNNFTPARLPNLALWLDANQIAGLNNGDLVTTWNDLSGNGRNFTGSGTNRPTYVTNVQNGKPAVRFNDVAATKLAAATAFIGNTYSLYIVASERVSGATYAILAQGGYNVNGGIIARVTTASALNPLGVNESVNTTTPNNFAVVNTPFRYLVTRNGTGTNSMNFYANSNGVNYSATATWSLATDTSSPVALGVLSNVGAQYLPGDIFEVVITSDVLTAGNQAQLDAYLKSKWGIS